MPEQFWAHVDYESGRVQPAEEHYCNVARFCEKSCSIQELRSISVVAGLLHDVGKLSDEIQTDYQNILQYGDEAHKHGLDHSTAGGQIVTELLGRNELSDALSTVIYSHHGLLDCIDLTDGEGLQERRLHKAIDYAKIKERFYSVIPEGELRETCKQAVDDYTNIRQKVKAFCAEYNSNHLEYGNTYFFIGMYWRILLSLLIDGDWTDTACFFENIPIPERLTADQTLQIWQECTEHFEKYMLDAVRNNPANGSALSNVRQTISDLCREAAESEEDLFRLTVPTGAGKTLSSLRFALHRAKKEKKNHILYIAPYNSILEQNAKEIRQAVGNPEYVLEHHCNVICDENEEKKYTYLTETWDAPIIVTTAVQILNTLFSGQKSAIRRMHTLCNSIIIFDEIQAFPVRCTELFHLAVNFLTKFCNTTIVLCSATQTTLPVQGDNFYHVCPCTDMAGKMERYITPFKRTNIIDATTLCTNGMNIDDLRNFTLEKAEENGSVLVVANTIGCALVLYQTLSQCCDNTDQLFHMSNNMCPQNKLDTLEEIKTALEQNGKEHQGRVICISTQVVEAGVNFSFGCVIRSMAGLDNVIQAAGRCNRHKEFADCCPVYIVRIQKDVENVAKLKEIMNAQKALQKVLEILKNQDTLDGNTFEMQTTINAYYQEYFHQLAKDETKYPAPGYHTTLVDLLGRDEIGRGQYERKYGRHISKIGQAFATAGNLFEVIPENFKTNVVVPYDENAKKLLDDLSIPYITLAEKGKILEQLQKYTVGISTTRKEKLNNAIYTLCEGTVFVLSEGYYDSKVGVCDEPHMTFNFV